MAKRIEKSPPKDSQKSKKDNPAKKLKTAAKSAGQDLQAKKPAKRQEDDPDYVPTDEELEADIRDLEESFGMPMEVLVARMFGTTPLPEVKPEKSSKPLTLSPYEVFVVNVLKKLDRGRILKTSKRV